MVKGYKVFNSDWTCKGKQYTCPGKFEEPVELSICERGMHFCKNLIDCFNYYSFDPENKVAEVVAYGKITERGDKYCTDKIEIVREITWNEVLEKVNTGKKCTGIGNSGDWNSGDWNSGNGNSGKRNSGDWNSGNGNSGKWNSGNRNSGGGNSGNGNSGDWNSGKWNSGDWNSGDWNSGNGNSGDWNTTNYSSGCFNTTEEKIRMFNEPRSWTYNDWIQSDACYIMKKISSCGMKWVIEEEMTEEEKEKYPEYKITGGCLRKRKSDAQKQWEELEEKERETVMALPNFDPEIFYEITRIRVQEKKEEKNDE